MKKYKCVYDGGSFIDSIEYNTIEEAQHAAEEILTAWINEPMTDEERDIMVCECMTWVEEFDETENKWIDIWYPSDSFCESIGFVERM